MKRCPLCREVIKGHGNNPAPLNVKGNVCDNCNTTKVIPARLKPAMTYEQRYAALELGDKLAAFAEQYKLSDAWIKAMYKQARIPALNTTGIDINEA